jgi:hypothetical protein
MSGVEYRLRHWRVGAVLVVKANGVGTLQSLRALREAIREILGQEGARSIVVDLRAVVHAMTEDDWIEAAEESASGATVDCRVAIVASPPEEEALLAHSRRMAQFGLLRVTLTSYEAALEWALVSTAEIPSSPSSLLPLPSPPSVHPPTRHSSRAAS